MDNQQAKAPWVEFKTIAEEDRQASIDTGSYKAKDVDYAFITPAGSKDCIERPVKEWFESLKTQVENGRFPLEWFQSYERRYNKWKETGEIPVEGTSVKNWAVASPAQVETMLKIHVKTVEQLATANEEVIGRLGMGGRNLVEKAKAYVKQQESGVGKLAEENADLRQKLAEADKVQQSQAEQLKLLQSQVQALASAAAHTPQQGSERAGIAAEDLIDSPPPKSPSRKL